MNMLKKAAVVTGLVTAFASTAFAEETTITACTSDGKTATLVADVNGGLQDGKTMKEIVTTAFQETARALSWSDLVDQGKPVFIENLNKAIGESPLTPDASIRVSAAPTVGEPACTP